MRGTGVCVESLRGQLDADMVDVLHNGIKVYVVPKALSKGTAVKRFRSYIGSRDVIAAGDSEFDVSMLEAADLGIAAPELAQNKCFFGERLPDKIICPSAERIYAEAVLETVLLTSAGGHF